MKTARSEVTLALHFGPTNDVVPRSDGTRSQDGSEHPGYIKAIPENWADIVPPPMILDDMVIPRKAPKNLFRGSPLAIIVEQRPCLLVSGLRFGFWEYEISRMTKAAFYKAIGKTATKVFPIRFQGGPGLAGGIVSGEIAGFCGFGVNFKLESER